MAGGGGTSYAYGCNVIYSGVATDRLLDFVWTAGVMSTKVYDSYEVPWNIFVQSVYYELYPSGVSDGYTMYTPTAENDYWDHQKVSASTDHRDYVLERLNYALSGMHTWVDISAGGDSEMALSGLVDMLSYDQSIPLR